MLLLHCTVILGAYSTKYNTLPRVSTGKNISKNHLNLTSDITLPLIPECVDLDDSYIQNMTTIQLNLGILRNNQQEKLIEMFDILISKGSIELIDVNRVDFFNIIEKTLSIKINFIEIYELILTKKDFSLKYTQIYNGLNNLKLMQDVFYSKIFMKEGVGGVSYKNNVPTKKYMDNNMKEKKWVTRLKYIIGCEIKESYKDEILDLFQFVFIRRLIFDSIKTLQRIKCLKEIILKQSKNYINLSFYYIYSLLENMKNLLYFSQMLTSNHKYIQFPCLKIENLLKTRKEIMKTNIWQIIIGDKLIRIQKKLLEYKNNKKSTISSNSYSLMNHYFHLNNKLKIKWEEELTLQNQLITLIVENIYLGIYVMSSTYNPNISIKTPMSLLYHVSEAVKSSVDITEHKNIPLYDFCSLNVELQNLKKLVGIFYKKNRYNMMFDYVWKSSSDVNNHENDLLENELEEQYKHTMSLKHKESAIFKAKIIRFYQRLHQEALIHLSLTINDLKDEFKRYLQTPQKKKEI